MANLSRTKSFKRQFALKLDTLYTVYSQIGSQIYYFHDLIAQLCIKNLYYKYLVKNKIQNPMEMIIVGGKIYGWIKRLVCDKWKLSYFPFNRRPSQLKRSSTVRQSFSNGCKNLWQGIFLIFKNMKKSHSKGYSICRKLTHKGTYMHTYRHTRICTLEESFWKDRYQTIGNHP